MTAFAGCLGGEAEEKKDESPQLVQQQSTILQIKGWAESNWEDQGSGPWIVDLPIPVNVNDSNIIQITFTIKVEDSDADHAESDQGSDPDSVTVSASGGANVTTDESKGMTPTTLTLEAKAQMIDEQWNYLPQSWTIQLSAECNGGKMFKIGPIPIPTRTYKDQGVAYTIDGQYTYMAETEEPTH